jgi:acetoin utilization deacetylase AcuC-like enzyme
VFEFARRHSIPVAWVLAGGYARDISKVVEVHLNTFQAALMA